jgi:hypothetical protein
MQNAFCAIGVGLLSDLPHKKMEISRKPSLPHIRELARFLFLFPFQVGCVDMDLLRGSHTSPKATGDVDNAKWVYRRYWIGKSLSGAGDL